MQKLAEMWKTVIPVKCKLNLPWQMERFISFLRNSQIFLLAF